VTGMKHARSGSTTAFKILCVDDEPDVRAVLEICLKMDPHMDVRSAGSARDALEMLTPNGWLPDIALLDMMMPEMNGCELAAALRATDHIADVAIIFVSANDRPSDLDRYRSVGAIGYIRKPFDPITLPKLVRDHMSGAVTSLAE